MRYDHRSSIESEVQALLTRYKGDPRRLASELADLVYKAYEEGERDGKRREQRRHPSE